MRILLILLLQLPIHFAFALVKGQISGFKPGSSQPILEGWACDSGVRAPINVHLYVGGGAGQGLILKGAIANKRVNTTASSLCGTSLIAHTFEIRLNQNEVTAHQGKALYVHGISKSGGINNLLDNSGQFSIPSNSQNNSPGPVVGKIEKAQINSDKFIISGWACQKGVSDSINIHLYLGGPAGQGQVLLGKIANKFSDASVADQCNTKGTSHGFQIVLNPDQLANYRGQSIYIHGIHKTGAFSNRLIEGSGEFKIPLAPQQILKLSQVARENQDLLISQGQIVTIDKSIALRNLTIKGELHCPPNGSYNLVADKITVQGRFICGTTNQPFAGKLNILLKPGYSDGMGGAQALVAANSGEIQFIGSRNNISWQRLGRSSSAGHNYVILESPTSWQVGSEIAIGPTGFDTFAVDRAKITKVNGRTITLDRKLKYRHHGEVQNISVRGKTWGLDQRAEVVNLTRNIRISTYGSAHRSTRLGGHVMVMPGASARFDGVEFDSLGRMGEMARYPVHWHRVGPANGQYVKNSSIHDSYHRCVTVHGTQNLVVDNNVCVDHFGHGYFLEDGNEFNNTITNNVGMLSRKTPKGREVLISDVEGNRLRFSAPATFWISNPDNFIENNVASGSQGTGFWMSFNKKITCNPKQDCHLSADGEKVDYKPLSTNTKAFNGNIAHTCDVGITWDGAPDGFKINNPRSNKDHSLISAFYFPQEVPRFKNLVAFKNRFSGMYYRGRTAVFDGAILADNTWSLFFAYNQIVINSLIVGKSTHLDNTHLNQLFKHRPYGFKGITLYDGPFDLRNVDFYGFSTSPEYYRGVDVAAYPFSSIGGADRFENRVTNIHFTPQPYLKAEINTNPNWKDNPWSARIRDKDGSLTGEANTLLVSDIAFNDHSSCVNSQITGTLACDYEMGLLTFRNNVDNQRVPFKVTRSDNGSSTVNRAEDLDGELHNKFHMIVNEDIEYLVDFSKNFKRPDLFFLLFKSPKLNQMSNLMRFRGLGSNCRLLGVKAHGSLASLKNTNSPGYYSNSQEIYFKLRANAKKSGFSSGFGEQAHTGNIRVLCN